MVRRANTKRVLQLRPTPLRDWNGSDASGGAWGGEGPPNLLRRSPLKPVPSSARPPYSPGRRFFIGFVAILAVAAAASYLYTYFSTPQLSVISTLPAPRALTLALPELDLSDSTRIYHRIKQKDTWQAILTEYRLDPSYGNEIVQALAQLEKNYDGRLQLQAGKMIELRLGRRARLAEVSFLVDASHQVVIDHNRKQGFVAEMVQLHRETAERVAVGYIKSSFAAAARQAGVSYQTVDELVDLFSDRVDFNSDLRVGDRFTVIFRDNIARSRRQIGVGPILAAALDINGERMIAARYVGTDGKARYFDGKGQPLGNSFLRYPLTFTRISSYFTTSRFHPILGKRRPHNGVDFAAPTGTPVRSVADAVVQFAGRKGGSGIMVLLKHNDRFSTNYLHLSRIAPGVRTGGRVSRGQVIGAVGATGLATGPHLHFGFFDKGKYVDPLKMKLPFLDTLQKGTSMETGYLRRVLHTLNHYQSLSPDRLYGE